MAKIVTAHVHGAGATSDIKDPSARQVVRVLSEAQSVRNGAGPQGFVTRSEMDEFARMSRDAASGLVEAANNAQKMASIVRDGYSKGKLQQDLSNGVKGILAGVGSDYRMTVDPDLNIILLAHKNVVYMGTSANPGPGQSAIGITANGVAMGFNDPITGIWKDAVAIDANTGNATFLGTVNATSGNFAESITVGNTGITLGQVVSANGYSKAELENDLESGVGSILVGSGGDYLMDVNTINSTIVLCHKFAAYKGTSPNPGPGRSAIGITANGIAMGFNDPVTGIWKDAIAISSEGNVTILGTLKAGSVIEANATVNGRALGDVATSTRNIYRGVWTSGTAYVIGDTVMYLDYGWSCIADHTASGSNLPPTYPATSNAYWTLASVKGAPGAAGPQGPQGPQGPAADVSNLLSKSAANILTGTITPQDTGGIRAGTITWNTSTGALSGGSGVAITEAGIIGAKNGVPSFTLDTNGNATFAGDINTAGDGTFSGKNTGASQVPIGGSNYYVDYSLSGRATTGPSWDTFVRAGVYGYADAPSAAYNVGVMGVSTTASNGIGVLGSSPYVAGHFSSVSGTAVNALSSAGTALAVNGKMTISSTSLVSNLNADLLDGYHASAFAPASHAHSNYVQIAAGATNESYLYYVDASAPSNQSTRAGWIKVKNNGGTALWLPFYT